MENNNKQPLTAEEFYEEFYFLDKLKNFNNVDLERIQCMREFANEQTKPLKEEIERLHSHIKTLTNVRNHEIAELKSELNQYKKQNEGLMDNVGRLLTELTSVKEHNKKLVEALEEAVFEIKSVNDFNNDVVDKLQAFIKT